MRKEEGIQTEEGREKSNKDERKKRERDEK